MMEAKYAHPSLFDVSYCAVSQIRCVARKNKSITRTLHLIRASELFDNLTGFRGLPRDIKGAEGGYEVGPFTLLQRKKKRTQILKYSSWVWGGPLIIRGC
jgi:hypothetical protein